MRALGAYKDFETFKQINIFDILKIWSRLLESIPTMRAVSVKANQIVACYHHYSAVFANWVYATDLNAHYLP